MNQEIRWTAEAVTDTVIQKDPNATINETAIMEDFDAPAEVHDFDAYSTTILNLTLIACLLLAYFVKQRRLYFLPESAGALIIGVVVGGIARLVTNDQHLVFFEFVSIGLIHSFGSVCDTKTEPPHSYLSLFATHPPVTGGLLLRATPTHHIW